MDNQNPQDPNQGGMGGGVPSNPNQGGQPAEAPVQDPNAGGNAPEAPVETPEQPASEPGDQNPTGGAPTM